MKTLLDFDGEQDSRQSPDIEEDSIFAVAERPAGNKSRRSYKKLASMGLSSSDDGRETKFVGRLGLGLDQVQA